MNMRMCFVNTAMAATCIAAGGGVLGLGLAAGCGRSGSGDMMGSGMMGGATAGDANEANEGKQGKQSAVFHVKHCLSSVQDRSRARPMAGSANDA